MDDTRRRSSVGVLAVAVAVVLLAGVGRGSGGESGNERRDPPFLVIGSKFINISQIKYATVAGEEHDRVTLVLGSAVDERLELTGSEAKRMFHWLLGRASPQIDRAMYSPQLLPDSLRQNPAR